MNIHTATETAYKNGYKQALLDVLALDKEAQYTINQIVSILATNTGERLFNQTENLETEM